MYVCTYICVGEHETKLVLVRGADGVGKRSIMAKVRVTVSVISVATLKMLAAPFKYGRYPTGRHPKARFGPHHTQRVGH